MTTERPCFDGARALAHARHLAVDIGPRLGGTPGERAAGDYVAGHLRSLGLQTVEDEFPVRNYRPIDVSLTIFEPDLGVVPCQMVFRSKDTPVDGVEGDILVIDGIEEQSFGPEVNGRILLTLGRPKGGALRRAVELGAAAVISVSDQLGTPAMRGAEAEASRAKLGGVPTVTVSFDDGLRIARSAALRARIVTRSEEAEETSRNVIGDLVGSIYPDEITVVCGHYDSSIGVPGASDNAGGTAMVLELARVMAERGSMRTLRFIAFGAEELGMKGSMDYVRKLSKQEHIAAGVPDAARNDDLTDLHKTRLCLNIDVQGAILATSRALVIGPPDLTAALRLLSLERGPTIDVKEELCNSDGIVFSGIGIPSVTFTRRGAASTVLHTEQDIIDRLSADSLQRQGRYIELLLLRTVARARAFAFERRIPEGQQAKLREYFARRGDAL